MYSERQLRRAAEKSKRWFDAASKLPRHRHDRPLGRLIHEGDNHIRTVEKMQSNMRPLTSAGGRPANDRLIARHLRGWKTLVAGWKREAKARKHDEKVAEWRAGREAAHANSAPPGRLASVSAFPFNTAAPEFTPSAAAPPPPMMPTFVMGPDGMMYPAPPMYEPSAFVPSVALPPAPPAQAPPASAPELPEAFTAAAKYFRTANGLAVIIRGDSGAAPPARIQTLGNLASEGRRQIQAVQAVRSSYPPGSRVTIAWRCLKWKYEMSCWDVATVEAALHALRDARIWAKIRDNEKRLVGAKQFQDETCQQLERFKPTWLKHRAKQRKKRTCSHCGTAAPLSARAFPYCGGCRHSAVPRVDRPRYCSEECQRAHWLAGHMNECPSCTG